MSWVDILLVVVRVLIGCWLLWSIHILVPGNDRTDLRGVSVVVPARDEESSLPDLLASLPADIEVVVVDDHSTDATAGVAAGGGARIVESRPLPDGWTGKAWACAQGAEAATGSTLVFVDADVAFEPGGFEAVVAALDDCGGLVSVQPFHEPGRPVERLASIFNIIGFAGTDAASPLGWWRGTRGAFGPVLATRRIDHRRVGGHEAIRASVVDDVALAARYRDAGLPVTVMGGRGSAGFRMYPEGFGQLVEGFTKNMAAGATAIRRITTALIVAWTTLLVQASVAPVRAVLAGDRADVIAAGVVYLVVAAQYWWMARRLGRFGPGVAIAFPVSIALFLVVFTASVAATVTGSVSWRGRRVSTRSR